MSEFNKSTSFQEETVRRAVLVAQSTVANTLLFLALGIYLAVTTSEWQSFAFVIWIVLAEVFALVGVTIIRRGQMNKGGWLFLSLNLIGALIAALLFVSLGYVATVYILISAYFSIRYVLPRESQRSAMGVSIIALVLSILAEVINPAWRQVSQLMLTIAPVLTVTLGLAFIVVVVRQAWSGNIRTRLLASFLVLVILPLITSAVISTLVLRRAALTNVYDHLASSAALKEDSVNKWVGTMVDTLGVIYHTHEENTLADTLLSGDISSETLADTQHDLESIVTKTEAFQELFILNLYGKVVVSSDQNQVGKVYDDQEFFRKGQADTFIQPPQYSQSLEEIVVIASRPLRTADGKVGGVLAGRANLATLNAIMLEDIGVGQTGETYLVRTNHALLTNSKFEGYPAGDTYIRTQGVDTALDQFKNGTASYMGYRGTQVLGAYRWLPDLELVLVSEVEQDEALQAATTSTVTNAGVAVGAAIIAVLVALYVTRTIADPLGELVGASGRLAAGDLDVSVEMDRSDEIGVLAGAFNNMARQLTDLIANLERRVTDRTRDLAIVAEVGTATATILESKRLLQEVVDLTKERFNLYHSHIYLLDEKGENLVLTAGAGEPGRIMVAERRSIPLSREQSLVARAARERKGVIVNDVTQEPNFLPNPLLPDTRSELAVPMIVGGNVIGVFDIQSEQVGRFTDSDINIQTTLAAQLAISIQNVRSFEQSKKQAELQSLVNVIGSRIQRSTSIEDTLQTAIRELGTAIGATRVRASLAPASSAVAAEPIASVKSAVAVAEGDGQSDNEHPNTQVA